LIGWILFVEMRVWSVGPRDDRLAIIVRKIRTAARGNRPDGTRKI
jgi:hypothetical protein